LQKNHPTSEKPKDKKSDTPKKSSHKKDTAEKQPE